MTEKTVCASAWLLPVSLLVGLPLTCRREGDSWKSDAAKGRESSHSANWSLQGEMGEEMGAVPCSLLAPTRWCRGELKIAQERVGRGREAAAGRGSRQKELSEHQWCIWEHQSSLWKCSRSSRLDCWSLGGCWVWFFLGCVCVCFVFLASPVLDVVGFFFPRLVYCLHSIVVTFSCCSNHIIFSTLNCFIGSWSLAAWSSSSLTLSSSYHIILSPPTALTLFPPSPGLAPDGHSTHLGQGWLSSLFARYWFHD